MKAINQTLANIALLVLDVDGVLTDGAIVIDDQGVEYKHFHSRDGHGMKALLKAGIQVAIISGRKTQAVNVRMRALGIENVIQGSSDKKADLLALQAKLSIAPAHTACMGDDTPDLPMFEIAAVSATVSDAHPRVLNAADWISTLPGGKGAVREFCDLILANKN